MTPPDYKKELEEFAYIVSHDLNAPLRHIRSFGGLLVQRLEDKVTDEEREYLSYMEDSIHKAEAMLATLLEYSRLNDKKKISSFDCQKLVQNILILFDDKIKETQVKIAISDLPTDLQADKNQIQKVFTCLIDNALKFCASDRTPEISIKATETDSGWTFTLTDNGIGVPLEQHDAAFKMFKRLDPERFPSDMGAGLSFAKKIIENHHGSIQFHSKTKEGLSVSFTLPKEFQ